MALHLPHPNRYTPAIALSIATLQLALLSQSVRAGEEWGYAEPARPSGLAAPPAKSLFNPAGQSGKPAKAQGQKPKATASQFKARIGSLTPVAVSPADRKERAIQYWLAIYALVSPQPLTDDLKKRITDHLSEQLKGDQANEVLSVLDFWPRVESASAASPEQRENYKSLIRSLLRVAIRRPSKDDDQGTAIMQEVLGPLRIAAAGDPPLTEDAIDAYADMACFLFEQKNPGKTVDAVDNRAVMATVIRAKYTQAPTAKDRAAMANFDLSWTKFKILWTGADERGKQKLLSAWTGKDATAGGITPSNPTLQSILTRGPWSTAK